MIAHDLYIRLSDPSGKHGDVINHHRVWDSKRFVDSQAATYQGPKVKNEDQRIVTVATKQDYDEYRNGGKA